MGTFSSGEASAVQNTLRVTPPPQQTITSLMEDFQSGLSRLAGLGERLENTANTICGACPSDPSEKASAIPDNLQAILSEKVRTLHRLIACMEDNLARIQGTLG